MNITTVKNSSFSNQHEFKVAILDINSRSATYKVYKSFINLESCLSFLSPLQIGKKMRMCMPEVENIDTSKPTLI